jgi:hypothetical protein
MGQVGKVLYMGIDFFFKVIKKYLKTKLAKVKGARHRAILPTATARLFMALCT